MAFLDELAPEDGEAFLALASPRRFARGVVLFHAGDEAGSVMVVRSGRVKISSLTPGGQEVVLGVRGPRELLGELSAVDGGERSATVTALDAVEVVSVSGQAFTDLLARRPAIALVLLRLITARLRDADRQRLEYAAYDVFGRVARRLLDLAEPAAPSGSAQEVSLSHEELAAWTASSREAVSKALAAMRALGWIETRRRAIVIADLEALRRAGGM
jgi:CRP/FNR family transcriptional regulator, cyclic AMP receptor protein